MNTSETINSIKKSFEVWYNKTHNTPSPVSIVINYSDTQRLSIKAFHTVRIDMEAIGLKDNHAYTIPIVTLQENYNHGTTTPEEAREGLTQKLLMHLYSYPN